MLGVALLLLRNAGPAAVGSLYLAAVTVPLVAADVRERRLPNALVLPGYVFLVVGVVWDGLARGSPRGGRSPSRPGCSCRWGRPAPCSFGGSPAS
ncbi:hypothetical protein Lxx16820 [Leifsonia xyli subsp. xyli str. CTCB07]|uniref:Uncharacterized protein n=1 Tax=Leifsonia xyli subsp. xyli (strain CTCB07) TaxID=281090 RepID=Q6ADU5_LEIXX|nr:hypothetical protein Lxx16820 [Leifsonia xyli subsp. xyli str. CTCB07]